MCRLMRKHGTRHHIADREDMRDIGTHLIVDLDDPTVTGIDAGFLYVQLIAIRPSSHCNENPVINTDRRCILALETDFNARHRRAHASDFRRCHYRFVTRLNDFQKWTEQICVCARHQRIGQFHNTDINAECAVHARHFETDDATTHDKQAPGQWV